MDEIDKKTYRPLKYFAKNTRATYEYEKQEDYRGVPRYAVVERLSNLGYLGLHKNAENLHDLDYMLTEKGYEVYNELGNISHKDRTLSIAVSAVIVSLITLYFTGRANGWW